MQAAPTDVIKQIQELQAALHAAGAQGITVEAADALSALTDQVRRLLGIDDVE